ncbi:glycosyltransferase family 2 protein, partial [Candidatus Aerophobetes bacterium]
MKEIALDLIQKYNWLVLLYFLGINGTYILLNILSFFAIKRYLGERKTTELEKVFQSTFFKPISIITPAYNEEETIAESVKSLLQLQYPQHEVVVVNDGSKDRTLKVLVERYKMVKAPITYPMQIDCKRINQVYISPEHTNLVLVDKDNGGKGDALNAGINVARYPLVCSIDADSLLESDALLKVVRPFLENPNTVAVGGIVRIANGCKVRSGEVIEVGMP